MLNMEPVGTESILWKPIQYLRKRPKQIPNKQWALAQEVIVDIAENCSPVDVQERCSYEVQALLIESNPTPADISLLSSHMFAQRTFELCTQGILSDASFHHLDDEGRLRVQERVLEPSLERP